MKKSVSPIQGSKKIKIMFSILLSLTLTSCANDRRNTFLEGFAGQDDFSAGGGLVGPGPGGQGGGCAGPPNILSSLETESVDNYTGCIHPGEPNKMTLVGVSSEGSTVCVMPVLDMGDAGQQVYQGFSGYMMECIEPNSSGVEISFDTAAEGFNAALVVPAMNMTLMLQFLGGAMPFPPAHSYGVME